MADVFPASTVRGSGQSAPAVPAQQAIRGRTELSTKSLATVISCPVDRAQSGIVAADAGHGEHHQRDNHSRLHAIQQLSNS